MVCLGFESGPQDGRRRRNHGAMAATHTFQFLQQINMKKCIWCRDSNSQPLAHESPAITNTPELPPNNRIVTNHASLVACFKSYATGIVNTLGGNLINYLRF